MTNEKDALKGRGLLIDPQDLDPYLSNFKNYEGELSRGFADASFWKERRVLVTGINGFAGSYLAERLLGLGSKVYGLVRRHSVPSYSNLSGIDDKITLFQGNLQDINSIMTMFNKFEPEIIFHLGAQSFVPTSFISPIETYEVNILGTANILEAVRQSKSEMKGVHLACSSEEYGKVYPEETPIKETNPLRPLSPYALSKVATDMLGVTHHKCYGIPTVITRSFNHTGPKRGLQFVTSVVTRQIAQIKTGMTKTMKIGNTSPIRDFTDVRDIIEGYILAMEKAKRGEVYNLGHGYGISIGNLIELAAKVSGVSEVKIEVDKSRFRPAEVEILICDYTKAKDGIGYRPRVPITQTLKDSVDYFIKNPSLMSIDRH